MQPMLHRFTLLAVIIFFFSCSKSNPPARSIANNDVVETSPPYQQPYTVFINQYIGGYYEALPAHYATTDKKYPLLLFLHGGGQVGDGDKDLPLVLNDGVAKIISEKKFPPSFSVNGEQFSFIVLSPQFRATPPDSMVMSFLSFALKKYRIDPARVYLTGLSMGGVLTSTLAGTHTATFAAAVPIAGESFGADRDANAASIASGGLALWAFHNANDPTFSSTAATEFVNSIKSFNPVVQPRLTIFPAFGHDAWTAALDPLYRENNMNVYEWMLHYKR
ncbi:MAG TPA: PHB depolymerase family esterase [Chitinophagaceae bacterium]|nr:PHB depolymerase family esterase [Chitinophagaceae bacterium]